MLLHDPVVIFLARLRVAGRGGGVAESEGTDADEAVRKAEFLHQGLAFGGGEHFAFTVDPAGAEADGMGGVHHVAQHERAVGDGVRPDGRVGAEYQYVGGRAVEGVGVHTQEGGVHLGNLLQEFWVLHGHDPRILAAHARRGPGAGFQHGPEFFVFNLLRFVAPAASALSQRPQYFVVHMIRV